MTEKEPEVFVASMVCPFCEADLPAGTEVCQRCGIPQATTANPWSSPAVAQTKIEAGSNIASTFVSIFITGGLFLVLLLVAFESPGLAIFLALFTIPPWVRTAIVMWKRKTAGLETSAAARLSMFAGSLLVTWLILFVALTCCFLTFCFTCIGALSLSRSEQVVFPLIGIATIAAFVVVVAVFSPWIQSRFIRDINKK